MVSQWRLNLGVILLTFHQKPSKIRPSLMEQMVKKMFKKKTKHLMALHKMRVAEQATMICQVMYNISIMRKLISCRNLFWMT
uniref:Uncharacterized protein n=1 Tax=Zea mays TaxID=4577 RepID=C4IZR1_MAIZE|nr:unknown [Zea mays]ACR36007.1 unknown [Zea mays]